MIDGRLRECLGDAIFAVPPRHELGDSFFARGGVVATAVERIEEDVVANFELVFGAAMFVGMFLLRELGEQQVVTSFIDIQFQLLDDAAGGFVFRERGVGWWWEGKWWNESRGTAEPHLERGVAGRRIDRIHEFESDAR